MNLKEAIILIGNITVLFGGVASLAINLNHIPEEGAFFPDKSIDDITSIITNYNGNGAYVFYDTETGIVGIHINDAHPLFVNNSFNDYAQTAFTKRIPDSVYLGLQRRKSILDGKNGNDGNGTFVFPISDLEPQFEDGFYHIRASNIRCEISGPINDTRFDIDCG